jgi:hypothetical protein
MAAQVGVGKDAIARINAELRRANEILKAASAFFSVPGLRLPPLAPGVTVSAVADRYGSDHWRGSGSGCRGGYAGTQRRPGHGATLLSVICLTYRGARPGGVGPAHALIRARKAER